VSRNALRKVLRSGETSFEYEREVSGPHALLDSNATMAAREQLTLIRIFEDLRGL
jgi:hypothetical protein